MGRKTVPNTWPGDSEAPVAELCCVCVERHTISRWKSVAAVEDLRRPDVCRRRGTEVRDQTNTRRHEPFDAHCCHMGTGRPYKASCVRPGQAVICNFWHPGTLITAERQSARMSKITNDGLTRSGTECCIAVPIIETVGVKGLSSS